jgi:hypothetical protein
LLWSVLVVVEPLALHLNFQSGTIDGPAVQTEAVSPHLGLGPGHFLPAMLQEDRENLGKIFGPSESGSI